jgi:hypothetical protein
MKYSLRIVAVAASTMFASLHLQAIDLPRPLSVGDRKVASAHVALFRAEGETRQKWRKGMPLPASLREAGLSGEVRLVWSDIYLDGGTRGYLICDSQGSYLALCTGPGLQTSDHPRRIDAPVASRLFMGAIHYTHENAQLVVPDSESERFLCALLNGANKSLQPTATAVMPPAAQEIMPAVAVAEH